MRLGRSCRAHRRDAELLPDGLGVSPCHPHHQRHINDLRLSTQPPSAPHRADTEPGHEDMLAHSISSMREPDDKVSGYLSS
jgi:hypothetical protein